MAKTPCFSRNELRGYLLGDLPETDLDQVALHVEECGECEATVAMLDRESDTLIESLRTPVEQEEPASAYRLAAKQAARCWRDSAARPAPDASVTSGPAMPRLRDYELIEPLARGGMGTVYRARHVRLNRQVALKVLPGRWLENPVVVARFQREMQAVGSLQHPAIVQATDGGEAEGVHFLVMELIDGLDGSTLVQHLGPLPVPDACEIARQAAEGMAYVHEQGIVHRDLKPSNVMVTQAGDVKVLDLGLARIVGEQLNEDELTTVGQLMGTLDFMAPEQLENSHEVDERADIYSLGATLFKLLTGRSPHSSEPREPLLAKLHRIASERPLPLEQRRPDAPAELCQLVDSMLSHDVADRPETMAAVAAALAELSESSELARRVEEAVGVREQRERSERSSSKGPVSSLLPWETKNVAPQETLQQPRRGRRVLVWTAVALLLAATALGVIITLQTTAGTLVIETATPDVEVRVLKAGEVYRQLTLTQKANSLRLGAGEYEIELVSAADALVVQNGSYTLKRGETWLAKIAYKEKGELPVETVAQSNEPTYEGKTLDQWIAQLQQDRSPKQLYAACQALEALSTGGDTARAVAALLVAMRHHDSNTQCEKEGGGTVFVWTIVLGFLGRCDQAAVVAAIEQELEQLDEANVEIILNVLSNAQLRPLATSRLLSQVERIATEGPPANRTSALAVLQILGSEERATRRLVAALSDREISVRLFAADLLIKMQSSTPQVVSTLRQTVRSGELQHRANAAWLLGDLGVAARPALPELIEVVESQDDEVSRVAAYPPRGFEDGMTGLGLVSVKDAAVRALAEIGDKSVVPVLFTEWEQRTTGGSRSKTRTAAWNQVTDPRQLANTYTHEWVADAIEQLIGMRPEPGSNVWHIGKINVQQAYRMVFTGQTWPATVEPLYAAQQLMSKANEFEIECVRQVILQATRIPKPEELAQEIKLIELLAQADEPSLVLEAMFVRWAYYAASDEDDWQPGEQVAAVQAYRACAMRILRATEDWKTTLVPQLFELRWAQSQWPAVIVLIDVLEDLDEEQQLETVLRYLRFHSVVSNQWYRGSLDAVTTWLEDETHRVALQQHLEQADDEAWVDLMVDLQRAGLAEVVVPGALMNGFQTKPKARGLLLQSLISSLDDQPEFASLVVKLLQDPVLDETYSFTAEDGEQDEWSIRARYCLTLLMPLPKQHRPSFTPLLEQLVESGKDGEPEAAKLVGGAWK